MGGAGSRSGLCCGPRSRRTSAVGRSRSRRGRFRAWRAPVRKGRRAPVRAVRRGKRRARGAGGVAMDAARTGRGRDVGSGGEPLRPSPADWRAPVRRRGAARRPGRTRQRRSAPVRARDRQGSTARTSSVGALDAGRTRRRPAAQRRGHRGPLRRHSSRGPRAGGPQEGSRSRERSPRDDHATRGAEREALVAGRVRCGRRVARCPRGLSWA